METGKKRINLVEKKAYPKKESTFEAERAKRMHAYSRAVKRLLRNA